MYNCPQLIMCHLFIQGVATFRVVAGGDAGKIFNCRAWSSTVLGLRRFDLDPAANAKDFSWAPLIILQGPTEPVTFEYILAPSVDFFYCHDPGVFWL